MLHSLQAARDASVAVRASKNRAWDAVNLHRMRAVRCGEHTHSNPVGQMLSAALVGTAEHDYVRRELTELSEGRMPAEPVAETLRGALFENRSTAALPDAGLRRSLRAYVSASCCRSRKNRSRTPG
ncbi:hypothetical protein [Streptomyces sp. NPDC003247]|uniref:hypothetical protein n=1 Tax=Streptomyces sp. NPDC003247 TaxID=3364677 RepID=UPI0036A36999